MAHLRTAFGDMYSSCIYRTAVTAPLRCGIRTGRNLEAFYRTYSSHTRECSSLGMLLPTPHKTLYQQRYFTTEGEVKNPSASAASTTPTGEVFAFKAETSRLLEIVAHSLYVDREIFIRELISNASDALEKLRFLENTAQVTLSDSDIPLKIMISTDDKEKLFIIEDTGIGMDKQEMIENLGTIAKSGSLEFLENSSLSAKDKANAIIGKFGVGFYSSFVVANEVQVFTCSFDPQRGNIGWHWISDGLGSFSIQECADLPRGTKIVLKLKEECYDFCNSKIVEKCAEKFSSFVSYPLYMKEGETEKKINIQEAVWLKDTITEEEHQQFFRYLNGTSYGDPMMTLSFRSDAPLSIKSLFYIPEDPPSRMFQTKHEVGVSLHSRRVLVKKSADDIIPKWLFFIKGVVDCEDMPLNVSRENMQDLRLIEKLSMTLVKRILRFFEDQAKMDPEKYSKFYRGYSYFLKEGLLDDVQHKNQYKDTLMKLLRFECSNEDAKTMISFDDYIAKMHPKQQNLYYFCASDRKTAMASPYLEQFLKKNRNVLLLYEDIDEFVAMNIQKYQDKKLVAVDASEEDFEPLLEENEQGEDISQENIQTLALLEDQKTDLEGYIKSVLGEKVTAIKYSDRLVSSPAIVTGFLSSSLRKMMKATMRGSGDSQMGLTSLPVTLELNPSHSIVTSLFYLKTENPTVAKIVTEQLYDNACIAAGILDDPRSILERLNSLLEVTIRYAYHHTAASSPVSEDSPTPSESVGEVKTNEEEVHVSPPDVHSTEVTDPSENTKGHPTSP